MNEAKKPLPVERPIIKPIEVKATPAAKAAEPEKPAEAKQAAAAASPAPQKLSTEVTAASAASADPNPPAVAKKPEVKLTLWEKVKHEANHYWDGTKLLGAEIKIAWKLALKMAAGYELTRREHRQVWHA